VKSASTALGKRRFSVLRVLARAGGAPLTTTLLAARAGQSLETVRKHLLHMEGLGLVARLNYRRWSALTFPLPASFDASILD